MFVETSSDTIGISGVIFLISLVIKLFTLISPLVTGVLSSFISFFKPCLLNSRHIIPAFSNKGIKFSLPLLFLFLVYLQIVIGAFVSGMDAGQIYNSWPLMGNSYFPDDNNFLNLFDDHIFQPRL